MQTVVSLACYAGVVALAAVLFPVPGYGQTRHDIFRLDRTAYIILDISGTVSPASVKVKVPAADTEAEKLAARMTDPKASFKDRCAAEDELAKLRPQDVLPKLLPQLAKGMPEGGIWNSGTRETDRHVPIPWQIYNAVGRAWTHQVDRLPRKEAGKVLLALLQEVAKDKEKYYVLRELTDLWDPNAEAELAKLLRNANEPSDIRQAAALPLVVNGKEDYRDVMLGWAAKADHAEKVQWFGLLADPRHMKRKGVDPRVISLGFKLIQADKVGGAYFLAVKTGAYVSENFAPNIHDPRYRGKNREQFFVDTVDNALRWWDKNRERIEKK